jgi:hypothetical protein
LYGQYPELHEERNEWSDSSVKWVGSSPLWG